MVGRGPCLKGGCSKATAHQGDDPACSGKAGGPSSCPGLSPTVPAKMLGKEKGQKYKTSNSFRVWAAPRRYADWGISDMPEPAKSQQFLSRRQDLFFSPLVVLSWFLGLLNNPPLGRQGSPGGGQLLCSGPLCAPRICALCASDTNVLPSSF